MKPQKIIVFCILIFIGTKSVGQSVSNKESNESSIYTVFDTFFEDEIKRQGVKRNWIFMLNEIYGLHKFDYNNDGYQDIFIEFSAVQEQGEGMTLYFAVLFKNYSNKKYGLVNYIDSTDKSFIQFEDEKFKFRTTLNEPVSIVYELVNSEFIKI